MNILYLEDHTFFAQDIIDILEDMGHNVTYVDSYIQCVYMLNKHSFDCSILDVILHNGKTGLHIAEEYKEKTGRVMFLTGCVDPTTLQAVTTRYPSANKLFKIKSKLEDFLKGGYPTIDNEEEIYEMTRLE